jgi:hypothetical protein
MVGLLFLSCNELPIGDEQFDLRGDFNAQEIELAVNNSLTEFDLYRNLDYSENLIVGKNSDYESRILLSFDFPDTTYSGLDEIKLTLYTNNDYNNNTINVTLHLLSNEFEESEANWLQRSTDEWWDSAGGDFDHDSLRLIEASGDSLVISFNYIELEEIMNADGLIIVPVDTGFMYFGSNRSASAPKFQLVKNDDVTTIEIQDDCHIVTGPEPFYIENWIGSGIHMYNYVKFVFDSVLIDEKAVYAQLSFVPEKHFIMRDSLRIGYLQLLEPLSDFDTPTSALMASEYFGADDTIFEIDIVKHIQHIIEYPDSNFGIFLVIYPGYTDIANYKIVDGSHTLKVGYVPSPQGRF